MNDALNENPDAGTRDEQSVTKKPTGDGHAESAGEVSENSPKPHFSFLETVRYWVIARS